MISGSAHSNHKSANVLHTCSFTSVILDTISHESYTQSLKYDVLSGSSAKQAANGPSGLVINPQWLSSFKISFVSSAHVGSSVSLMHLKEKKNIIIKNDQNLFDIY